MGHEWKATTCTEPETCARCGETRGTAKGHDWKDATCTEAKTCSVCGIEEGTPLLHITDEWTVVSEATPDSVGEKQEICPRCGETLNTDFEYYYDITQEEEKLYKNVLDTINSIKAIHVNPDSFCLLGAVAKTNNSRTTIYVSYVGLDEATHTEYFWKDISGDIVKCVFGQDNYLGTASKVYDLDLEEIQYFEKIGVYTPKTVEVSLDQSWAQYFD